MTGLLSGELDDLVDALHRFAERIGTFRLRSANSVRRRMAFSVTLVLLAPVPTTSTTKPTPGSSARIGGFTPEVQRGEIEGDTASGL